MLTCHMNDPFGLYNGKMGEMAVIINLDGISPKDLLGPILRNS